MSIICPDTMNAITLGAGSDLALSGWNGETYLLTDAVVTSWNMNIEYPVHSWFQDNGRRVETPARQTITATIGVAAGGILRCEDSVITQKHVREYSVLDLLRLVNERIEERTS